MHIDICWAVLICSVASDFCDPLDCGPPTSSLQGIIQAKILQWVAISYSKGSFLTQDRTSVSCISCIDRGFFITALPGQVEFSVSIYQQEHPLDFLSMEVKMN